jgi:opacity protein-like surface antigen
MKKIVLSVVAMAAVSTACFAGGDIDPVEPMVTTPMTESSPSGLYLGLGLSATEVGNDSISFFSEESGQDRMGGIVFQAGYEFNQYIAVEGRYSTSVSKGDFLERDAWGLYLKPQYPVSESMNIYALLGYGGMTLDPTGTANVSLDDNGFQWGIGASYDMSASVALFVDYVSIANDMSADVYPFGSTDISSASLTVGVTYKF